MNYLDDFKEHMAPFCKALHDLGNWLNDNRYKGVPNEITEQYLTALSKMGILTLGYTHIVKVEVGIEEKKIREELQDYPDDDPDRCPYGGICFMPGCDCYNDCPRYPHGGDDW